MYLPSPGYNDQVDRNGGINPNHGGHVESSNVIPTANLLHMRMGYGNGGNPHGMPPSMSMQQYQQIQQMQQAQQMQQIQQMQQYQQLQQLQHIQQAPNLTAQILSQMQPPLQQIPQFQPQMQAVQSPIHNPTASRLQQTNLAHISQQFQQPLQYPQHFQPQMQIPFHHAQSQRHDEIATSQPSPPGEMATTAPISLTNQLPAPGHDKLQSKAMLVKKKRGRPKKLILDPTSKEYIDSSHPRFKQLNKMLKESANASGPESGPGQVGGSKPPNQVTHLRDMDEEEVKELLKRKDRRGRPRKFPIEETGLTIKGIRVNGSSKNRKAKAEVFISPNSDARLQNFSMPNSSQQGLVVDPMNVPKMSQSVTLNAIDGQMPDPVKFKPHIEDAYHNNLQ